MEQTDRYSSLEYTRKKRAVIIAALVFSAAIGPFEMATRLGSFPARIVSLVGWFGSSVLAFSWVYFDSIQRHRSTTTGLRLLIVFLGMIGLFIYLVKSRGLKQGLISSVIAVGLVAGMLVITTISGALVTTLLGI